MSIQTEQPTTDITTGPWVVCNECGSCWPVVHGQALTGDNTPLHRNDDGSFECLACGAKINPAGAASLAHKDLRHTVANLQRTVANDGLLTLTANEAQALLQELRYRHGYEQAYRTAEREYDELVKQVDLEYDEMADLITELYQASQAMAEYIALVWEDDPRGEPAFMPDARAVVLKAERYIAHYHKHMK